MDTLTRANLRARVRRLLATGVLPLRSGDQKLFGGHGVGQACACCGGTISASEVLYEIECPENSQALPMHLRCLEAWEIESRTSAPSWPQRLAL
jgi:hypothetical protein